MEDFNQDKIDEIILAENENRMVAELPLEIIAKEVAGEETLEFFDKMEEYGYEFQGKLGSVKISTGWFSYRYVIYLMFKKVG